MKQTIEPRNVSRQLAAEREKEPVVIVNKGTPFQEDMSYDDWLNELHEAVKDQAEMEEELSPASKYGWDTYCYVECEEETQDACKTCERRLQATSCPICKESLKLHEIQAGAKMCGECYETYESDDLDRALLRGKSPAIR